VFELFVIYLTKSDWNEGDFDRTSQFQSISLHFSGFVRDSVFPAGAGNFSLHHRVQNGSGALPASYPMGTRGSFPGGKAARV
jgi:hypothetical protein